MIFRRIVVLFLSLIVTLSARELESTSSQKIDFYWISYQGRDSAGSCCPVLLMQIDQFGNVVHPPKTAIRQSKLGSAQLTATALAHGGSNEIRIWAVHQGPFQGGDILRATIDKTTLTLASLKTTSVKTTVEDRIQVTQRAEDNFLTLVTPNEDGEALIAFGLTDRGHFDGTRWNLSSTLADEGQCALFDCGGGVSSNGRTAFVIQNGSGSHDLIMIQPLNATGRPKLNSVIVASAKNGTGRINAADVTSALPDGKKFVVYVRERTAAHEDLPDRLFLQVIDAKTGQPTGDPIHIRTFDDARFAQNVAIDPLGHFLIVSVFNVEKNVGELLYQALDVTGHASGAMKLLAEGASSGVDILKD